MEQSAYLHQFFTTDLLEGIKLFSMQTTPKPSTSSRWLRLATIALILLGVLVTVIFALRTLRSFMRVQRMRLEPGTTDVEMIRGWMTIPYISRAYDVPADYLFEALGIPENDYRNASLSEINRALFPGQPQVVLAQVKAAVIAYQAGGVPMPSLPTLPLTPTPPILDSP